MAIQFCANDNRAFDDTRIGRQGGLGGQCVVCNQQVCFDCMQNRNNVCAICGRFVCDQHSTHLRGKKVCSNHGFLDSTLFWICGRL